MLMEVVKLCEHILNSGIFPILACIYLAKWNRDLQNTINNLTVTLTGINERIGNIEDQLLLKKKEVK